MRRRSPAPRTWLSSLRFEASVISPPRRRFIGSFWYSVARESEPKLRLNAICWSLVMPDMEHQNRMMVDRVLDHRHIIRADRLA